MMGGSLRRSARGRISGRSPRGRRERPAHDLWRPGSAPSRGRVPRDRTGKLRGDTRGFAAPARPQSAGACRHGGCGRQSRGLPVGERQAKACAHVLASDRTATAATRELGSCQGDLGQCTLTARPTFCERPLARNQLPVPAQNRVWRHDRRDVAQPSTSQPIPAHGEPTPVVIAQPQAPSAQVTAKDAVLFE